jgi:hypothetical protein
MSQLVPVGNDFPLPSLPREPLFSFHWKKVALIALNAFSLLVTAFLLACLLPPIAAYVVVPLVSSGLFILTIFPWLGGSKTQETPASSSMTRVTDANEPLSLDVTSEVKQAVIRIIDTMAKAATYWTQDSGFWDSGSLVSDLSGIKSDGDVANTLHPLQYWKIVLTEANLKEKVVKILKNKINSTVLANHGNHLSGAFLGPAVELFQKHANTLSKLLPAFCEATKIPQEEIESHIKAQAWQKLIEGCFLRERITPL